MPPSSLLSPSELSYLHTSLSLQPPIRPDARSPTSFRPLIAETDLLPSTNGSARLCFADGTEAIVGVKAELERTAGQGRIQVPSDSKEINEGRDKDINLDVVNVEDERQKEAVGKGQDQWVEVSVDMPGFQRDDDGVVVFLAQMLQEGLVADGRLKDSLWISPGWYWRLYVDVCRPIFNLYSAPQRAFQKRDTYSLCVLDSPSFSAQQLPITSPQPHSPPCPSIN